MSEYQYYEFQAIDRPLGQADQEALRALSTRARITATSFTNSYEWGDFKGDPARLMENWFDLHLYLANWGSRRLMIRWPARLVDRHLLGAFLGEVDCAQLRNVGKNLILDIVFDEVKSEEWDDGSGWLAALAPLRTDVLGGDLRLFYLLWLTAVEADVFEPDELEPMPGIGPMTGALEAFADFFNIDPDLVAAAAEQSADPLAGKPASSEAVQPIIAAMTDQDKTKLLARLFDGDAHVGSELRARSSAIVWCPKQMPHSSPRAQSANCVLASTRFGAPGSASKLKRPQPSGNDERWRLNGPAVHGSTPSPGEAKASGGRLKPRSSAATRPVMTKQPAFFSTSRRSPKKKARSRTSSVAYARSATTMPVRSGSSNDWRNWSNVARYGVEMAEGAGNSLVYEKSRISTVLHVTASQCTKINITHEA
jgi:hypothetical protein